MFTSLSKAHGHPLGLIILSQAASSNGQRRVNRWRAKLQQPSVFPCCNHPRLSLRSCLPPCPTWVCPNSTGNSLNIMFLPNPSTLFLWLTRRWGQLTAVAIFSSQSWGACMYRIAGDTRKASYLYQRFSITIRSFNAAAFYGYVSLSHPRMQFLNLRITFLNPEGSKTPRV